MKQGSQKRAETGKEIERAAAARLIELQGEHETDAAFARRAGLPSQQYVWNYKQGRGMALGVLARVAMNGKLSRSDLLYVLAGKRPRATDLEPKERAFDEIAAIVDRARAILPSGTAVGAKTGATAEGEGIRKARQQLVTALAEEQSEGTAPPKRRQKGQRGKQ